MKFLVLSHTHSLLPFAYRLQLEGSEVQPVVAIAAFEAAWRGKMPQSPRDGKGKLSTNWLEALAVKCRDADWTILTDDWRLQHQFSKTIDSSRILGVWREASPETQAGAEGAIRIGGWFNGSNLLAPHLLVVDRGAWPGGMGPAVDSALTLIRVDDPETQGVLDGLTDVQQARLSEEGFRGLVQFDLQFRTATGRPEVSAVVAGWPFLQTHAFLSELEGFSELLTDATSLPVLPKKFVTVITISRAPWPTRKARFRFDTPEIQGLTPEQMGQVFWHDVQVDEEGGRLTSAGLDGLIGVSRGAADTSELARVRSLEVALRLGLPEKQFRPDAGVQVQAALAELEGRFGVLV